MLISALCCTPLCPAPPGYPLLSPRAAVRLSPDRDLIAELQRRQAENQRRGLGALIFVSFVTVWLFTLPADIRRAHICTGITTSQKELEARLGCVSMSAFGEVAQATFLPVRCTPLLEAVLRCVAENC